MSTVEEILRTLRDRPQTNVAELSEERGVDAREVFRAVYNDTSIISFRGPVSTKICFSEDTSIESMCDT